jgi:HEAT repeat protein
MERIAMRTSTLFLACFTLFAQSSNLDDLLAQAAKWQWDTSRKPLLAISEIVRKAPPEQKRDIEQKFIALLKSDATPAGKDFVCRELSVVGSEASAPVLAAMLLDPKTADNARYALERIPGPAIDRVLRDALAKSTGRPRLGIVNTLGMRADHASVATLRPLALAADPAEAAAAQFALARIADTAAVAALAEAYAKNKTAAEPYLQAADRLAQRGNTAAALPIYRTLYAAAEPAGVRAAALRGLAAAGGAPATPLLMEALRGSDLRLQAIAVPALLRTSSAQLVAELPKLPEAAQVRVLAQLSERRDASALPAFTTALQSMSKPVRLAALQGIGPIGTDAAVHAISAIAAGDDPAEQAAARAALARIPGKDVDAAIGNAIAGAPPKVKRELIRERGATAAAAALPAAARDPDPEVRRESLKALAAIASAAEISRLVELVVNPAQPDERAEAARTLGAVIRRSDPARIKDVLGAYAQSTDVEVRGALLRVMGQSGNPAALDPLRKAVKDSDATLVRAAILALGEWPDTTTVPDLLDAARSTTNAAHRVLAVRGAIQLIGIPNAARPYAESVKMASETMLFAKESAEKRAILALLPRYPIKESLDLAASYANDPDVAAEAKAAVGRLERTVRR